MRGKTDPDATRVQARERHAHQAVLGNPASVGWLFVELAEGLSARARGAVRGRLSASCEAEDLVSETWARVIPSLRSLRGDHGFYGALRGYLFRAMQRVVADLARRQSREESGYGAALPGKSASAASDGEEKATEVEGVTSLVNQREVDQIVARELRHIPELDRRIVRLRVDQDLTFPEIAARVALSESAVSKRFQRTCCALRQRLYPLDQVNPDPPIRARATG